jgi:hypothetical protein
MNATLAERNPGKLTGLLGRSTPWLMAVGSGSIGVIATVIVFIVHVGEAPADIKRLDAKVEILETNTISKQEFWKQNRETQDKLTDLAVAIGNANGKLDVLLGGNFIRTDEGGPVKPRGKNNNEPDH